MADGFVPRLLTMSVCVRCEVSRVAEQVIDYVALMSGQLAAFWTSRVSTCK